MKKIELKKLKELIIEFYPDSLFYDNQEHKYCATTEFLVGTFAGRSFDEDSEEKALHELWKYFNLHIGHDSIVGNTVTKSGWPDLDKVKEYIKEDYEK